MGPSAALLVSLEQIIKSGANLLWNVASETL
jgi:hypothetical protein